jgi:dimethylhistidine N-methyltransferase
MQRFTLLDRDSSQDDFAADVRRGLAATPKFLLPRYLYDDLGSALFEAICHLPEYPVTRAESEILSSSAADIARAFGRDLRLIELGSGSARKTRYLLDAIASRQPDLEYVPVDVDAHMLESCAAELLREYPSLRVTAVRGDLRAPSRALEGMLGGSRRNIVLFLGSTIGNLDPAGAATMLRDLASVLSPSDAIFLGADLRKPKAQLEAAYDDPLGVTAAFNLNLLGRINRELGGTFRLAAFSHLAFFNEAENRIEMHLVSRDDQTVRVGEDEFSFAAGETIHTENSYKYDEAALQSLAAAAGLTVERIWTDSAGGFADVLLRISPAGGT